RELTKLPPPRHACRGCVLRLSRRAPQSRRLTPKKGASQLSRKLWLSTVTVVIALLAVFATSAAAKPAKVGAAGGTLNVDMTTDVDYTDPALDYLSTGWEIEYSTCLKLMNYPDAN